MIESIKPWLRAVKYDYLKRFADYRSQRAISTKTLQQSLPAVAFLIGGGRSGTTILGEILSRHADIAYFFEPYHLWAAINPLTDVLNLYHRTEAKLLMDAVHINEETIARFDSLFLSQSPSRDAQVVIEKTPLNSMRIGYLHALNQGAKFIHLVRDGIDVSRSIERIASTSNYKIAGKPRLNQWWGVENYKWKALSRDGASAGYYPDEIDLLEDECSKGAYEWLVSLGEVDRWRNQLGDRLYEIKYDELTANPEVTLRQICQFLELDSPRPWLDESVKMIQPASRHSQETVSLPPRMCEAFNRYQERFGCANRTVSRAV